MHPKSPRGAGTARLVLPRAWRALARRGAALLAALSVTGAVAARELPAIDRLGDAPTHAAFAAQQRADARPDLTHGLHSRLGVPTFLWGERGGTVGETARRARPAVAGDAVIAARGYLRAFGDLYALPAQQAAQVPVLLSEALPNGGALVKFRNRIDGIEVFNEDAAVLLGPEGELVSIGGYVMGGEGGQPFLLRADEAIAGALLDWGFDGRSLAGLAVVDRRGDYDHFALPPGAASAQGARVDSLRVKKVLYRMPETLRPGWFVEALVVDGGALDAYAYVIDAGDGSLLFRKNLSASAEFYSYRAYATNGGIGLPFTGPYGRNGFPHPTATPDTFQPAFVGASVVTLNNAGISTGDDWLPAGATETISNYVDAYADFNDPDGLTAGDFRAGTNGFQFFDWPYQTAADADASASQRKAGITNVFYLNNWLHDWFYDAGFNEAAGNGQADNHGRGGNGGDAIHAETQDAGGRNNANMVTPGDGVSPRMQMYIFEGINTAAIVTTPAAIAGRKAVKGQTFGPQTYNVTGNLALSTPLDGCAIQSGLTGKIVLMQLSLACSVKQRAQLAEAAGAIGVVFTHFDPGPPPNINDPNNFPVNIPTVIVAKSDGDAIRAQIAGAVTVGMTLAGATGPDRDGALDNTVVIHEWGHYLSNRLIGNALGLNGNQQFGMGEGFADFTALLVLVAQGDAALANNANFGGTYAMAAYASNGGALVEAAVPYYGGRRYPYSRDMTKNPLTFKHIQSGVALPATPAPNPFPASVDNAEPHNTGEVWATMLWECYSNLLNDTGRLTFAQAQDRMRRYLVQGLKLTPVRPTFTEARDALLAAMLAQDGADYAQCLKGFTKRGLGLNAIAPDRYATTNSPVTEHFVEGGAMAIAAVSIEDLPTYCDLDGYLDNGETGSVRVTLQNFGTGALTQTTGSVGSSNPKVTFPNGAALSIPSSSGGQRFDVFVPVTLAGAVGVEQTNISVNVLDPGVVTPITLVSVPQLLNVDETPNDATTDSFNTKLDVWTPVSQFGPLPASEMWHRVNVPGTQAYVGPAAPSLTFISLVSPPLVVASGVPFTISWSHVFQLRTDAGGAYQGGKVLLQVDGDLLDIGTSVYNGTVKVSQTNVLSGAEAFVGTSAGFPNFVPVSLNLGTQFGGKTVQLAFAIGTDRDASGAAGAWIIDDVAIGGLSNKPFPSLKPHAGACHTVSVVQGTPQFARIGNQFSQSLRAQVKNAAGQPVQGALVTFVPPAAGASASFFGTPQTFTDASGFASTPSMNANGTVGTYNVAAVAGLQTTNFQLVNTASKPIDMDADNAYDAMTDGLLIMRYLFGLDNATIPAGAVGAGATRTGAAIGQYAANVRPIFDVDGDGTQDPTTDGVMIVRYLMGYRGTALTQNAKGANPTRDDAQIQAYIQQLVTP